MAKRPLLEDVARLAGVHKGTASRALNDSTRARVSPDTVRKIEAAATQLGYSPNVAARELRRQRTNTVGVLIPDLTNPFWPPILRGIQNALEAEGYAALVASTDSAVERERRGFHALLSRRVDGLIVGTALRSYPIIDRARDLNIPTVLTQRLRDDRTFSSVAGDDRDGVRQIVEHLVALGHRQIAHIAAPLSTSIGYERVAAFREAVAHAGLDTHETPVVHSADLTIDGGKEAAQKLFAKCPSVTAIFACNDLVAVGTMRAMRSLGLRCPGDVSLVGFNDTPLSSDLGPPLTTVRLPLTELGTESTKLLFDEFVGPRIARQVLLPVHLIVRSSSAPPPPRQ